jgi:hypothetical protein
MKVSDDPFQAAVNIAQAMVAPEQWDLLSLLEQSEAIYAQLRILDAEAASARAAPLRRRLPPRGVGARWR